MRQVDATHVYSVLDKEVERLEQGPEPWLSSGSGRPIPFEGIACIRRLRVRESGTRQGGYVDAEKIVWRDVAALVALGHIDFAGIVHNHFNRHDVELETDRWGMIPKFRPEYDTVAGMPLWAMEVYYRFLNCGFRLPVSAGSASGVKASPLGYNRVYVKVQGPFSYERWFAALKAGRSFATNGPMLFLTAGGQAGRDSCGGGRARFASASRRSAAPARAPRGRLAAEPSCPAPGRGRRTPQFDHVCAERLDRGTCFEPAGRTIRFAHTSPVYVDVGGTQPAAEDAGFFVAWIDREMAFFKSAPGFRQPQDREDMLAFFAEARDVYARMMKESTMSRTIRVPLVRADPRHPARTLRNPCPSRRRRHGRGLSRPRHPARSRCRGQDRARRPLPPTPTRSPASNAKHGRSPRCPIPTS